MEENKYYTPSINEFHIGFEYEIKNMVKDMFEYSIAASDYIKMEYSNDPVYEPRDIIEHYITDNNIRIKYLDREDIESLGWSKRDSIRWELGKAFTIKNYHLLFYIGELDIRNITIYQDNSYTNLNGTKINAETCLFYGIIKNKSELKVLMNQIGINV